MQILNEVWEPEKFLHFAQTHNIENIVFDVDNTLIGQVFNLSPFECNVRSGAVDTIRLLHAHNVEIFLWSAGGRQHCLNAMNFLEIDDLVSDAFKKTPYPMQTTAVIEKLGFVPNVTVDNDPTEAVETIPFIECNTFWGVLR